MYKLRFRMLTSVILMLGVLFSVQAQENPHGFPTPELVVIPGTIQSEAGCPGDWQPDCTNTALQDQGGGIWQASFELPAGSYEYKAALDGTWDRNYGQNGEPGGPNIQLVLEETTTVTFTYDHGRGVVFDSVSGEGGAPVEAVPAPVDVPRPEIVNIPGTIQEVLGCPGTWQPDCEASLLEYDEAADVWLRSFEVSAGSYEYKVAINGSWAENYGAFADQDGPNIALAVPEDRTVTFVYDHKTKWISDDVRHVIATAPGSYQDEIGCPGDWQPECLRSWLQDLDGDGIYNFTTTAIPAGDYEAKVAIGRSWDENYGKDGVQNGENITFSVAEDNTAVTFTYDSNLKVMVISVGGGSVSGSNLRAQRAHWVLADTILWEQEADAELSYRLLYSPDASMQVTLFGLQGDFEALELSIGEEVPAAVVAKFPHLAEFNAYTLQAGDLAQVGEILRGQYAITAFNAADELVNINGIQIPGVLDDLYTYDGALGLNWDVNGVPSLSVWAPTARSVNLHLFDDSNVRTEATVLPMIRSEAGGVWRIVGLPSWKGKFYLYEVEVFAPSEQQIVTNLVTDPYSVSLSVNSLRSQLVNLNDAELKPEGWDKLEKPVVEAPEDITVYETHIRDFSVFDESVPEELRGTYLAFTLPDTNGMQHLAALAEAGLTHLHLLPSFDIATINENKRRWLDPDYEAMAGMAPDSEEQQALIDPIRDLDGFNWGYDPYHYMAVEGSYATNTDGAQRILEYRQMVQALNEMGLLVVNDVVFNHTNAWGQSNRSVLDRVVPGYYYRLNDEGRVYTSTCCPNTATEHNMMRRLMIDTLVLYATQYKIDSFRFDLMGHHMLADMVEVREALDALTVSADGVDGQSIYVYGEGWNFGEVADNARGVNATQMNIAGTGIGVFNDRLRDAVRGGNPFGDRLNQGLSNGLFVFANGKVEVNESLERLLLLADNVRIGLAGNLREFTFEGAGGELVDGTQIDYNGSPAAYTADPQENIIYVSKHDNETLYDTIMYKAPDATTMDERVRMQILGLSYVAYAQGVPFFHAGSDMLRSKSMDRDSYNSGDWFNRLDFSYTTNNFGVGLPPAEKNQSDWEMMRPFLANPDSQPTSDHIVATVERFRDMLRVRYSSPLFRLRTAEDVIARLSFLNTGPEQIPGLIVMALDDTVGEDLDLNHARIVVLFNGRPEATSFAVEDFAGSEFALHPALAAGADAVMTEASFDAETGTFSVPAWTTAVFVLPQG